MDIDRAREIVSSLADGIDPLTGEVLPSDHICYLGEVVRAFYTLLYDKGSTQKRLKPENARIPWTTETDDELRRMYEKGMDIGEISKHFGRTAGAIKSRLDKLGITR